MVLNSIPMKEKNQTDYFAVGKQLSRLCYINILVLLNTAIV